MRFVLPFVLLLVAHPAWALSFQFPSSGAQLFNDGTISTACGGPLGSGMIAGCFRPGDGIEETFLGTGVASITTTHLVFDMFDGTFLSFDPAFDVFVNDQLVGSYLLANGTASFDLLFTHAVIAGPDYTVRIIQTNSPIGPSGSYTWTPSVIVPEPGLLMLLAASLGVSRMRSRRAS